tara:strand:- start:3085 stop:4140 length:1056 start_codon:yes stop_codon:yes gene_type:complete
MNTLYIDLEQIKKNYLFAKKVTNSKIAAVVKSDCYGLGVNILAPFISQLGCRDFFVSNLKEGIFLRKIFKKKRNINIYILQGITLFPLQKILENKLIPVLSSNEEVILWNNFSKIQRKKLPCVINIDTGMKRTGLNFFEFKNLNINYIEIKYILSHLSYQNDPNNEYHKKQLIFFNKIKNYLNNFKYTLASSIGLSLDRKYHFDMLRIGENLFLNDVISLYTKIINISIIHNTTCIGYNCTYKAKKGEIIAVLPIGYSHGYSKKFGNIAYASIEGYLVPVIGEISMEMTVINITNLPLNLQKIGKRVELIGPNYPLEKLCKEANVEISEIMVSLKKIKRMYKFSSIRPSVC